MASAAQPSASHAEGATDSCATFAVGDRVLANYCGQGMWCAARICRDRSFDAFGERRHLYDIDYEDGDSEALVGMSMLRRLGDDAPRVPRGVGKRRGIEDQSVRAMSASLQSQVCGHAIVS